MFDGLSGRLGDIFDKLRGRGSLNEADVKEAMREVRVALLEADVALPVVKDFIAKAGERAVGHEVLRSVTPGQQVVKIVHDSLVEMLGGTPEGADEPAAAAPAPAKPALLPGLGGAAQPAPPLDLPIPEPTPEPAKADETELNLRAEPPVPILMVGLQGSGKTTTTAKIALRLKTREGKKVLMASLDTRRPAAQEQLAVLGEQVEVATLPIVAGQQPIEITKRAIQTGRTEGYDVVLLDTAGRLAIDEELMAEVASVRDVAKPVETLLVADAMTGQDAVTVATNFRDKVGLTGIVLTRVDGDARGGAALSMRAVTGKPIKLMGTGEKVDALEAFHADRIASRILGMGDVVSLVEKAAETIEKDEADRLAKKIKKGAFDLDDLAGQLRQMRKMGGMQGLMNLLPGVGKIKEQMKTAKLDDGLLKRQEAIISSMTKFERQNPRLIHAKRKIRIAKGSGTTVQDVNKLLKQHQQMASMMKKVQKMGKKGLMRGMQGLAGPGGQGGLPPGMR
ncbi:MAG: signal recognition particle protein [Pseudomonadota bacterium]